MKNKSHKIGGEVPTNGAKKLIKLGLPYNVKFSIQGTADYLYHRWNCEVVEEQQKSKKGSNTRKFDNLETMVYRNNEGFLCVPSSHIRASMISAARYKQDPRSPRKSAMDLYKAGIFPIECLSSLGIKDWDYVDKQRAVIQRASITRSRPAIKSGYIVEFIFTVALSEYISSDDFYEILHMAGKFCGIGDQRPTYGRFKIVNFEVI